MVSCKAPQSCPDPYQIHEELKAAPRPIAGRHSNISSFYDGRTVFITGASGFIGKVLIEKLVRCCPGIRKIYVLIRPKWNKDPKARIQALLEEPLFDGVRHERNLEDLVELVEGDVIQPNLGLSGNDMSKIIEEVSVIFHSAATVKFDDPLKQAVAINTTGTRTMIEICRRMPRLAALVHVSTAYANCDRDSIEEHIYPVDMDPEKLVQMADWLDEDTLQELRKRLIGTRPNTYTYTKALAEWLLVKTASDLPVVVCRPSIVVASHQEPLKGWVDNVNGPTGVILGAGKGLVRSMIAEKNYVADLVPVDTVISLMVALGWFAHINRGQKSQTLDERVYSFTDSMISASERSNSPTTSTSACSQSTAASSTGSCSGDEQTSLESPMPLTSEIVEQVQGQKEQEISGKEDQEKEQLHHQLNNHRQNRHHQHRRRHSRQYRKQMSSSSSSSMALPLDQHEQRHQQRYQPEPVVVDEKLQIKLKQFRQKTKAKLSESDLPEGIADIPVFHCTSGSDNPVTWGQIQVFVLAALALVPSITIYRYPCGSFTSSKFLDKFYRLTLHYAPAYVADFITRLAGGKPILVKIFKKFDKAADVLKTFTSKQWHFSYENSSFLYHELMNDEDRRLFNCDMKPFKWEKLLYDYTLGVRKFILKEPMDNLEQAKANLKMTYYRNLSLQVLLFATFSYCFVTNLAGIMY